MRSGIQLDENGDVEGYWIRNVHPGDSVATDEDYRYYPKRLGNGIIRVFHHYDESEAGVLRGIPRQQVGLKRLKNTDEYTDAEIERNYVGACHTAFVRTDLSADELGAGSVVDGAGRRVEEMSPGQVQYLGETDDITMSNPSGAPATYEPFVSHQGRQYAAGAGTSYEVAANDFRGMSYSAGRLVWNAEYATCDVMHAAHAECLIEIYTAFVFSMVRMPESDLGIDLIEFVSRPWDFCAVRVIAPPRAPIDPAREDRNALTMVEKGVTPFSDLVERKNGEPAQQTYQRIARDNALRDRIVGTLQVDRGLPPDQPSGPTQPGGTNPAASEANGQTEGAPA